MAKKADGSYDDMYKDDLAAAHAGLEVERAKVEAQRIEILGLRGLLNVKACAEGSKAEPSAWDKFWATSWMKTMLTGFVFVNILWIVWAHYAGQPEKEELRKLQLQHDGLKTKMKKERAISIMLEAGMLTVDVGRKRVLQSIPLDGNFEKVLKKTTPGVSDDVTFSFTAKKAAPDLDPEINYTNLCASLRRLEEDVTELEELDKKSMEYERERRKARESGKSTPTRMKKE
jgi:hypothetical protein